MSLSKTGSGMRVGALRLSRRLLIAATSGGLLMSCNDTVQDSPLGEPDAGLLTTTASTAPGPASASPNVSGSAPVGSQPLPNGSTPLEPDASTGPGPADTQQPEASGSSPSPNPDPSNPDSPDPSSSALSPDPNSSQPNPDPTDDGGVPLEPDASMTSPEPTASASPSATPTSSTAANPTATAPDPDPTATAPDPDPTMTAPDPTMTAPVPTMSAAPSASASASPPPTGQELYTSSGCGACHGADAQGTVIGPNIQHPTDDLFDWIVVNGGINPNIAGNDKRVVLEQYAPITMPANNSLDQSELDLIRDWLQDDTEFPPPASNDGAGLFALHCAYCHGDDALGGAKTIDGPPQERAAYASAYHSAPFCRNSIDDSSADDPMLVGFREFVKDPHAADPLVATDPAERTKYMPPFQGILTDAEIDAIYAWTPKGNKVDSNNNPVCSN